MKEQKQPHRIDPVPTRPQKLSGFRALDTMWTPAYVLDTVGGVEVPIVEIEDGNYADGTVTHMTVADYYERIADLGSGRRIPYLAELSYDEHFPALAAQLVDPPEILGERYVQRVMYFGRGVHSQIHYHKMGSAVLFAIHGTKIVRLWAPDQTSKLYKRRWRNFSNVTIGSVGENTYAYDRAAFPRFDEADFVEFEVEAGDALFIPMYWWHAIQNLDSISLTAVYFWEREWRNTIRELVPPELPPLPLAGDYAYDLLSKVKKRLPVG